MTRTIIIFEDTARDTVDDHAGFGALETERGRLPLTALDVQTYISGVTAQTTVRQTFRNALDETLEATYIFPLPDRAAAVHAGHPTRRSVGGGRGRGRYERSPRCIAGHATRPLARIPQSRSVVA